MIVASICCHRYLLHKLISPTDYPDYQQQYRGFSLIIYNIYYNLPLSTSKMVKYYFTARL